MARIIATGKQSFVNLRVNNCFYVDKTKFIIEWWNGLDDITLLTRPRRFGKTLMLDTVNTFFSPKFADRSDLFAGLDVWKDEKFRKLQGTIPVIFLSFASIKGNEDYASAIEQIKVRLANLYSHFRSILDFSLFTDNERDRYAAIRDDMNDAKAKDALLNLSMYLERQFHLKPIILLDEYDSPLHEAWNYKYGDQLVNFMRGFFNSTFKTNPHLERGLITGITRVAKEAIFSDTNNLKSCKCHDQSLCGLFRFYRARSLYSHG